MDVWFEVSWLLLPAGLANMTPPLGTKIPFIRSWSTSIDGGRSWRGQPILGSSKTWRGLILGSLVGGLVGLGQFWLEPTVAWLPNISSPLGAFLFGLGCGLAALSGDLGKSFIKRRLGRARGQTWVPFDQLDFIVGAYLFLSLSLDLTWTHYLAGLVVYGLAHPLFSVLGYAIGAKRDLF